MTRESQSLAETLRRIIEAQSVELHTAIPGIVRSYDASAQTADIEPGLLLPIPALREEEEDPRERLPIIPNVPVCVPRGASFHLTFPLSPGDTVLLVFSESDINTFRQNGQVADPGVPTRHGLSGAVAIPGFVTANAPVGDASGSYGRIGVDGGAHVEFRSSEIRAGGSDTLAKESGLQAVYDAINAATPGSSDGGAALKAAIIAALNANANWINKGTTTLKGG